MKNFTVKEAKKELDSMDNRILYKVLAKIDKYVHSKLGDEFDLDMLGCVLADSKFSAHECFAYLYVYYPMSDANQVIKDFFAKAAQITTVSVFA